MLGKKFILRTDHSSLVWLRSFKESEGQLARWLERLEEFQFEVVHRKGRAHCNTDALACIPGHLNDDVLPITNVALASIVGGRSPQVIRDLQIMDELVGPVFCARINDTMPSLESIKGCDPKYRKLVQIWDQLVIKDDLL